MDLQKITQDAFQDELQKIAAALNIKAPSGIMDRLLKKPIKYLNVDRSAGISAAEDYLKQHQSQLSLGEKASAIGSLPGWFRDLAHVRE